MFPLFPPCSRSVPATCFPSRRPISPMRRPSQASTVPAFPLDVCVSQGAKAPPPDSRMLRTDGTGRSASGRPQTFTPLPLETCACTFPPNRTVSRSKATEFSGPLGKASHPPVFPGAKGALPLPNSRRHAHWACGPATSDKARHRAGLEVVGSRLRSGAAGLDRNHLGTLAQAIQVIRPLLHQLASLGQELGAVVGTAQGIPHAVG